jgi:hypothetical protein
MSKPTSNPAIKSPEELALMKKWVETWKTTGPLLEKIRREEIRKTSTVKAMQNLADAFDSAAFLYPLRPSSGLVEQQALFQKLRKCSIG